MPVTDNDPQYKLAGRPRGAPQNLPFGPCGVGVMGRASRVCVIVVLAVMAAAPMFAQEAADAAAATGTNHERMPGHIDSWISLAILFGSLAAAAALNGERPAVRVAGTLLAALGCLAVPAWFVWVLGTGVLANPRPFDIPTDAAKPALMWLQAATGLIAGLFLLLVARWQARRTDRLALPLKNTTGRYGRASRILHWTSAILFLLLIPMGIFTTMIPADAAFRQGYYVAHKTIGLTVLGLVFIRLIWNAVSLRPALEPSLKRWERQLAHGVHIALYGLLIAFPLTGFVMSTYNGKLSHWFIWDLPMFWSPDEAAIIPWALMHKLVLPYLFFILIGAHIAGALKHQFLDGHKNTFRRMVS